MILAGKDTVVSNKEAKAFFNNTAITDKDLITYEDADHLILYDKGYWPSLTLDSVGFFNTHI